MPGGQADGPEDLNGLRFKNWSQEVSNIAGKAEALLRIEVGHIGPYAISQAQLAQKHALYLSSFWGWDAWIGSAGEKRS
jgi:hypothetical protein